MSDIAIRVENLSKRYRIGLKEERHDTVVGAITEFIKRPAKNIQRLRKLSRFDGDSGESEDIIWALKDVSFEIERGRVIGLIGRNGAGKTTLLKILSRITEPTKGRAIVTGRVSSLLEVGTGFHPELTGRENVYLNGTILGMKRVEIDRKFDEIVDFSGVEKFIDTPIKRYSSGMQVRLAFSVAAHLEPEILLVDEVLAVGDQEFQKKCLGKMEAITDEGRTILFVSHNMAALQRLCSEAILLEYGCFIHRGDSPWVVQQYLESNAIEKGERIWEWNDEEKKSLEPFIPISLRIMDHEGKVSDRLMARYPFRIELRYRLTEKVSNLRLGITLQTLQGEILFSSYDRDNPKYDNLYTRNSGNYLSQCIIPGNLLNDRTYCLGIISGIRGAQKLYRDGNLLTFKIDATDGIGAHWGGSRGGILRPDLRWSTEIIE